MRLRYVNEKNATFEGLGTCFSITKDGMHVIATNRHVLDPTFRPNGNKYVGFKFWKALIEVFGKDEQGEPTKSKIFYLDNERNQPLCTTDKPTDVSIFYDPQVENKDPDTPNDRVFDYCIPYGMLATEEEITNDLLPFDMIAFPGFPEWHDKNFGRAIIRGGTIACDPRFSYGHPKLTGQENIIYDGFSFSGSSGSPIFALPKVPPINVDPHPENRFRRLLLVGVNAGRLDSEGQHSGLSYFVKSSVIRQLIDEAELQRRKH